jgi:hypothetical protein
MIFLVCDGDSACNFNVFHAVHHVRIPVWAIPKVIMDNYQLWSLVHNGMVTCLIRKGMYGLPQAGRIAYDDLVLHLKLYGYLPAPHTPGLWRHTTRPTTFTLVVDDFGVKYTSLDDVHHLVSRSIGTMTMALSTFPCQAIMKRH